MAAWGASTFRTTQVLINMVFHSLLQHPWPNSGKWDSLLISCSENPGQKHSSAQGLWASPACLSARPFSSTWFFSFGQRQLEIVSPAVGYRCSDIKWLQVERKLGGGGKKASLANPLQTIEQSKGEGPRNELIPPIVTLFSFVWRLPIVSERQFQEVFSWAVEQHLLLVEPQEAFFKLVYCVRYYNAMVATDCIIFSFTAAVGLILCQVLKPTVVLQLASETAQAKDHCPGQDV